MSAPCGTLSISSLTHDFGATRALDNVSLDIAPGELVALLGPSGCGKTTLLRAIAGFLSPSAGEIAIDGECVNEVPANRRNIGIVFQNYALFPHMSVADNVAYGLRARGASKEQVNARVQQMLALVQMTEFSARRPKALSGGQQQRVALARALAIEPHIVLLDEPFSALDKNLRLDMQIEVKSLLEAHGLTAIIVTHDQEEALSMADRIVVLNEGRIEQIDTPEGLYDRPRSLFVNRFVGQANLLAVRVAGTEQAPEIALENGTALPMIQAQGFPLGSHLLLSIRPENLAIVQAEAPGTIAARARMNLPLGPVDVIEAVRPGGESVKVVRHRTATSQKVRAGTELGLAIVDPSAVQLFPDPDRARSLVDFQTLPPTQ